MRFHDSLAEILGNPVRLKVLRALSRSAGGSFTGRELARRLSVSTSQTIRALEQLEMAGVVHREIAGRAHLWQLSREHVLFGTLSRLFADEAGALSLLEHELKVALEKLPVERAWVFGSVARGDESPTSDVDLFVEVKSVVDRKIVEDTLGALSFRFARRFGNPLSTVVAHSLPPRSRANSELFRRVQLEGLPLTE